MFLARKITRAKWSSKTGLATGEIPADAVTIDLKTSGNTLSFWRCGTEADRQVEEAALAIAAAGDRVDRLDVVWVSDEDLEADGQALENTKGRTPVPGLVERHVDIQNLDYVRLGKVADRIVAAIARGQRRLLTKKQVAKLLAAAVNEGRVGLDDLREKVQSEVRKSTQDTSQLEQ